MSVDAREIETLKRRIADLERQAGRFPVRLGAQTPSANHFVVAPVTGGALGRAVVLGFDDATGAATSWALAKERDILAQSGVCGLIVAAAGADWKIQTAGVTEQTAAALNIQWLGNSSGSVATAPGRLFSVYDSSPRGNNQGRVEQSVYGLGATIGHELPDGRVHLYFPSAKAPDLGPGTWTWYMSSGSGTHTFISPVRRFACHVIGGGGPERSPQNVIGFVAATSGGSPTREIIRQGLPGLGGGSVYAILRHPTPIASIAYGVGGPGGNSSVGSITPRITGGAATLSAPGRPSLDSMYSPFVIETAIGAAGTYADGAHVYYSGMPFAAPSALPGVPGLLAGPNAGSSTPPGAGAPVGGIAQPGQVGIWEPNI